MVTNNTICSTGSVLPPPRRYVVDTSALSQHNRCDLQLVVSCSLFCKKEFALQKAKELQDKLGEGTPEPKKETQESESVEFKSIFPVTLKYAT